MILHDGVHLKKFRQKRHIYPTYGTILPAGIDRLIADLQLTPSDVFYDLGSGIGNVCTQVFAQTPVRKCVGIEQNPRRHAKATPRSEPGRSLQFRCANFAHEDISDATVLFMDSVMFSGDTLTMLEHKALACPRLRYYVSMKKMPPTTTLLYHHTRKVPVSWGQSQYHVYRTNSNSGHGD